jgi:hypothetical protein
MVSGLKPEMNTFECYPQSKVSNVVGLGVGAKNNLAKRFCITMKILLVTGNSSHKTRAGEIQMLSATRTSFYNRGEYRR